MRTQPSEPVPTRTELQITYIEEFAGSTPSHDEHAAASEPAVELGLPARFIAYTYGGGWWRLAWMPVSAAAGYGFSHEFAAGSVTDPVTPLFAVPDGDSRAVMVRAVGARGESTPWVTVRVATDEDGNLESLTVNGQWADPAQLPDPHDIRVETDQNSITLTWDQLGLVGEWGVYWRSQDGSEWGQRFVTENGARISDCVPGRYSVGVIARNGIDYSPGMGVWQDIDVGTRRSGDAPAIDHVRVTSTSITAIWQGSDAVARWDAQLVDERGEPLLGAVVDEPHATFTDLEPRTDYGVRVAAISTDGDQSGWSATSRARTRPPAQPDVPPPRKPA